MILCARVWGEGTLEKVLKDFCFESLETRIQGIPQRVCPLELTN